MLNLVELVTFSLFFSLFLFGSKIYLGEHGRLKHPTFGSSFRSDPKESEPERNRTLLKRRPIHQDVYCIKDWKFRHAKDDVGPHHFDINAFFDRFFLFK